MPRLFRKTSRAQRAVIAAFLGCMPAGEPAVAQPLEWFYGAPGPRYPRSWRPRPPRPAQGPPAEIPLPVPRPQFPSDGTPRPEPDAAPETTQDQSTPKTEPAGPAKERTTPATEPPNAPDTKRVEKPPAPAPASPSVPAPPATGPLATVPAEPPTPPPKPPELTQPRSGVAPSGATTAVSPRRPEDDPSCPGRLKAHLVSADPIVIGKQKDDRCVVSDPVQLIELKTADGGTVTFPDKPTLACITADAFAAFVREMLVPLAKGTFGAPVASVATGPGLECRSRDHIPGAKLSAHGQGLAVDIAQAKLADGRIVAVGQPKSELDQAFENAARAAGCGYFHTALGPGTDPYHATHWHFDLEPRGSGGDSKYCK